MIEECTGAYVVMPQQDDVRPWRVQPESAPTQQDFEYEFAAGIADE